MRQGGTPSFTRTESFASVTSVLFLPSSPHDYEANLSSDMPPPHLLARFIGLPQRLEHRGGARPKLIPRTCIALQPPTGLPEPSLRPDSSGTGRLCLHLCLRQLRHQLGGTLLSRGLGACSYVSSRQCRLGMPSRCLGLPLGVGKGLP